MIKHAVQMKAAKKQIKYYILITHIVKNNNYIYKIFEITTSIYSYIHSKTVVS